MNEVLAEPIQGAVHRILFFNEIQMFAIFSFEPDPHSYALIPNDCISKYGDITVTGSIEKIQEDMRLSIKGEWITHPQYGKQLKMESCLSIRPKTLKGIEHYLSDGMVKGIGPTLAKEIVNTFGDKTFEVLDKTPERLSEVKGIGQQKLEKIIKSWTEQNGGQIVAMFLADYGVKAKAALRIYKELGENAIAKIKENPYCIEQYVKGMGFKQTDEIAQKMGVTYDSPFRIQSAIRYILKNDGINQGHVCLYQQTVITNTTTLLAQPNPITPEQIMTVLNDMISDEALVCEHTDEGDVIFLKHYADAENSVATCLKAITETDLVKQPDEQFFDNLFDYFKENNLNYNELQRRAITQALTSKVFILTGGPGTGKTTTINGIIKGFKKLHKDILLAAPTGRASQRMSETTGEEAVTIHRLLHYTPDGEFEYNADNQLTDGDVVIVDESSMIDLLLMQHLVEALPTNIQLILVGDTNQLPSVGAGNVLKDLINSHFCPVVELTEIFRQAEDSMIVTNAYNVNKGYMPTLLPVAPGGDFMYADVGNDNSYAERTANWIEQYVTELIPTHFNIDPLDIQVLIPMYKGDAGVNAINTRLQAALNKDGQKIGNTGFCIGDKVMQTVNVLSKNIFNGSIGFIKEYNEEDDEVKIAFDGSSKLTTLEVGELDNLVLAYAITIHKSQGSEYPFVIMPILNAYYPMLARNLLYTGMTRAKKHLLIIGQQQALYRAVSYNPEIKRISRLSYKLQ